MDEKIKKTFFRIFTFIVLCFSMSCVGINYGNIIPDTAVTKAFEAFQIDPDMNYYYSGSGVHPNAIMGLKRNYVLDADLWKPIEAQPTIFKELIIGMQTKALGGGMFQHGFIMKDNKGQTLGIWYSILKAATVIKMGKDNKVTVFTPELETYREGTDDGKGGGSK
jgi:hypothetical protein